MIIFLLLFVEPPRLWRPWATAQFAPSSLKSGPVAVNWSVSFWTVENWCGLDGAVGSQPAGGSPAMATRSNASLVHRPRLHLAGRRRPRTRGVPTIITPPAPDIDRGVLWSARLSVCLSVLVCPRSYLRKFIYVRSSPMFSACYLW